MTQAFNLSQFANKVNTSGQADLTTAVTGTLPVANGGTGAATLTSGNVLIGAGTSAVTFVAAGTTGNVLTSNGTTWTSAAATGGQLQTEIFTAPGTWTKPASCSQVRVTVAGGGGGGSNHAPGPFQGRPGGSGGYAKAIVPVSAPVSITIGSGGAALNAGGTSSFGPAVSCTGGGAGGPAPGGVANNGVPGTGTVAVGTALRTSATGIVVDSFITGSAATTTTAAVTYSISGGFPAGRNGTGGTSAADLPGKGGVSGAIVVEFVG